MYLCGSHSRWATKNGCKLQGIIIFFPQGFLQLARKHSVDGRLVLGRQTVKIVVIVPRGYCLERLFRINLGLLLDLFFPLGA